MGIKEETDHSLVHDGTWGGGSHGFYGGLEGNCVSRIWAICGVICMTLTFDETLLEKVVEG